MARYYTLLILLAALVLLPFGALAVGGEFYLAFVTRVLIYALIAASLNLVVGLGGMVCFGHAAFLGIGAYVGAVLVRYEVVSLLVMIPLAVVASGLLAAAVGAISLRTRGVYFIMITLAFAQMVYYLVLSLKMFGGDDGLTLPVRGALGPVDLKDPMTLYAVVAVLVSGAMIFLFRLENSRFGRVIQAIRDNEGRTAAIGFPVYRYQLVCFTLGGALAGLGGVLLANLNGFVSPNLLGWHESGRLLIMVILGGVGLRWGGPLGAVAVLGIEEALSEHTIHWQIGLAALLLAVVLGMRQGLSGLLTLGRRIGA